MRKQKLMLLLCMLFAVGIFHAHAADNLPAAHECGTGIAMSNKPDLGPDTTICDNEPYYLVPDGNYATYLWSTGATTPGIWVSSPAVYILTVTDSLGATYADSITIEVVPAPDFSLTDTTQCGGGTILLDPAPCTGCIFYQWSTGDSSTTTTVNASGAYTLVASDTNGCSETDTALVHLPVFQGMLGPDTALCQGDTLTLIPAVGGTNSWSTGGTGPSLSVTALGTYWVEVDDGLCQGSDTIEVAVHPRPPVDLGNDSTFCAGDTLLLDAGTAGNSYAWTTGGLGQTEAVWAAGTYAVAVTNAQGCSSTDAISITVQNLPVVSLSGLTEAYCASDDPIVLSVQPQGGVFSGPVSGGVFDPSFWGPGNYQIGYTYTDSIGCQSSIEVPVQVDEPPSPADAGPDGMTAGDIPYQMEAASPTVGQGTWSVVPSGPEIENPSDPNTLVSGSGVTEGTYIFTWTVSNGACPSESDDLGLLIHGLMIPSGFSPNGDEKNDNFVIRGLAGCEVRRLQVFSRWGSEVYAAENYNNQWDGGNLSDDTYYYVLDLGEKGSFSGYVVIKR